MTLAAILVAHALAARKAPKLWTEYQKALAAKGRFSVLFLRTTGSDEVTDERYGAGGQLYVRRPDEYRLDLQNSRMFWDGKLCTTVRARDNELRRSSKEPENQMVYLAGLLSGGGRWEDIASPTVSVLPRSRKDARTGRVEQGFLLLRSGRDYSFSDEYWFDPTSHLLMEVTCGAEGMTQPFRVTYAFYWSDGPISDEVFVPARMSEQERSLPRDEDGVRYVAWPAAPEGKGRLRVLAPSDAGGTVEVADSEFDVPRVSLVRREGWVKVGTALGQRSFSIRDGYEVVVSLGAIRNGGHEAVRLGDGVAIEPGRSIAVLPGKYRVGDGEVVVRPGETVSLG